LNCEKACLIFFLNFFIFFVTFTPSILFSNDEFQIAKYLVQGTMSSGIDANETFSISGSIISTIDLDSNLTNLMKNSQATGLGDKAFFNESENTSISTSDDLDQENQIRDDSNSLPATSGTIQQPSLYIESNQTDNLSNNLVSMLSGIIIQSIEKGNPTINSLDLSDPLQLKSENTSIILAGNWQMSVFNSNITDFNVRFVMITSNGTGFHWHSMNSLKSDTNVYFGSDENIYLIGTVDFLTDNKIVSKEVKIVVMINNLETIQMIFLDDKIADHLYNQPLYGTIDKIEIPN
jgi:hypothetical protein